MEGIIPELVSFLKFALLAGVFVWLCLRSLETYTSFKRNLAFQTQQAQRDVELEKAVLNLKIQACERLVLFLDRIAIPNLLGRLNAQGNSPGELSSLMMLAIQKELEHNITQQLYVSASLWEIITLIKSEISEAVHLISKGDGDETLHLQEYAQRLLYFHQVQGEALVQKGHKAIKEEMSKLIQ